MNKALQETNKENIEIKWIKSLLRQWEQELKASEYMYEESISEIVIGIVGNSKLGKSTLINTLVGTNILPTLEGTICTSVGTKISYLDSDYYSAEIELISPQSLTKILEDYKNYSKLVNDLKKKLKNKLNNFDELQSHLQEAESKLEVPKTRLESVFGEKILKRLVSNLVEEEEARQNVMDILHNSSIVFDEPTPQSLAEQIKAYIDSGYKADEKGIPLWPLVHKVIIRGRFEILKTGVAIMDLPGITDSNIIRRNAALDEVPSCHYIWHIVDTFNAQDDSQKKLWQHIEKYAPKLLETLLIIPTKFALDPSSASETYRSILKKDPTDAFSLMMFRYQRCISLYSKELRDQSDSISTIHPIAFSSIILTDSKEWMNNTDGPADIFYNSMLKDNVNSSGIPSLRSLIMLLGTQRKYFLEQANLSLSNWESRVLNFFKNFDEETINNNVLETTLNQLKGHTKRITDSFQSKNEATFNDAKKRLMGKMNDCTNINSNFVISRRSLHWKIFECTMYQNGIYNENFNELMAEPIKEKIFSFDNFPLDKIKNIFYQSIDTVILYLDKAISYFESQTHYNKPFDMYAIKEEAVRLKNIFSNHFNLPTLNELWRDLQGLLIPYYYSSVRQERGTGTYNRMHKAFLDGVEPTHSTLFDSFVTRLDKLMRSTEGILMQFQEYILRAFENHFSPVNASEKRKYISSGALFKLHKKMK